MWSGGEHGNATPSSTHACRLHLEERREFFNLIGDVAYPNRAMMRRTLPIPGVHETSRIERKFIAAVGIAYLQQNGRLRFSRNILAISAGLFVAGWYWIFVHGTTDAGFARVLTYGLGAGLLIHAVVSAELEGRSFSPFLQWLGKIPYSLYIAHYLLVKWIANFTELWLLSTVGTIAASILLSIGLASALHITIEAPFLDWGRKLSLARSNRSTSDVPRPDGAVLIQQEPTAHVRRGF